MLGKKVRETGDSDPPVPPTIIAWVHYNFPDKV